MKADPALTERIAAEGKAFARVLEEVEKVVLGQHELLRRLVTGLLADGHVLLEGLPGLAKTLAVESLAKAIGGVARRIQFTPDLLPSDLTGTHVHDLKSGEWSLRLGPLFGNLVLADEINRAPAKVQSALLEAMQERSITIGGETKPLPEPFLVLATQNPLDQEGTYPLPEAQLDRFLMKVLVPYPDRAAEREIIARFSPTATKPKVQTVLSPAQVSSARPLVDAIYVDERIVQYVLDVVFASRAPLEAGMRDLAPLVLHGASPRASLGLVRAARAVAFLEGRAFVLPEDVKAIALDVLRHRLIPSFEAEAEGVRADDLARRILEAVRVP